MVFRDPVLRVIRVGNGSGLIIPENVLKSDNIELGDEIQIEIKDINRNEREKYQESRGYKKDFHGKFSKEKGFEGNRRRKF